MLLHDPFVVLSVTLRSSVDLCAQLSVIDAYWRVQSGLSESWFAHSNDSDNSDTGCAVKELLRTTVLCSAKLRVCVHIFYRQYSYCSHLLLIPPPHSFFFFLFCVTYFFWSKKSLLAQSQPLSNTPPPPPKKKQPKTTTTKNKQKRRQVR